MSDIYRRVVTMFEARGAAQVKASLGQMRSGFTGLRGDISRSSREVNQFERQWRAMETTMRYALAGGAVYGGVSAIRGLGEYQAKLGEIAAVADDPRLTGKGLDDLGNRLVRISSETATPIGDLQEGVLNLYSTIGNVPGNEAAQMMETIAAVSRTSQSDINDTTTALLGMINAFGRGTDELPKFGDEFMKVIQLSAGMPGHIYSQQLGRLQSSAVLGHFNPEQMNALAIGATRFGGSSATNMRGLAQMMTNVMNPNSPKAEKAFAEIGLTPERRQAMGGWETLMTVLRAANSRGGVQGNIPKFTDDMEISDDMDLGLSGGGAELLSGLFPRVEGRRIAAVLSQLMTTQQTEGTKNLTLDTYLQQVAASAGTVDEAMGRAMDRRRILTAGNAIHNMGLEIATAFGPIIDLTARGVIGAEGQIRDNRGLAAGALAGGAAAAFFGRRFLGPGHAAVSQIEGMASGNTALGSTPSNPMFVAVVYSLSGWGRGGGGVPGTGGGKPGGGGNTRSAGRFGKYLPGLGALGLAEGIAIAAPVAALFGLNDLDKRTQHVAGQGIGDHRMLNYLKKDRAGGFSVPFLWNNDTSKHLSSQEERIMERLKKGYINEDSAERMLRKAASADEMKRAGLGNWKASLEVTVHQKDTAGKSIRTDKVTIPALPDFAQPAPMTRGKNKTTRGR